VLLLNECLLLFISLSTQSGNFWINPRIYCTFSFLLVFFPTLSHSLSSYDILFNSKEVCTSWNVTYFVGLLGVGIGPSQNLCPQLSTTRKVKVKLFLCFNWAPLHEDVLGVWRYSSTHSLTLALDGGEWSASRPGRFTPRESSPVPIGLEAGWVPEPVWSRSGPTRVAFSRWH
jgi:hypothetical protein